MTKKTISFIAMIISVLIFLCGVLVIFGAFGGKTRTASSAPYSYDSGYASFGADFYTYVSNNAGEAASASRTAANNLDKIASLLKSFCGIMLMGFGVLNFCRFAMVNCDEKAKNTVTAETFAPAAPEAAFVSEVSDAEPAFEEPTVLFCKNCGNTLKPGQVFCGNCGTSIN